MRTLSFNKVFILVIFLLSQHSQLQLVTERCNYICSDLCGSWRTRWVILKESFVAYIRPKDGRVKAVILFDNGFEVSSGIFSTGYSNGLHIVNLSRHIVVKCPTRRITHDWLSSIKEVLHNEGRDFTMKNRYYSFTPVRGSVGSCWYVDGRGYMAAVADALEAATQEIFIADWWLSPEIHMKRPSHHSDFWRLDSILHRKAAQGVKVFVLLYKEVEVALGINSYYSKQRLISEYPENIKVIRHPDHAKAGVFLWAHHEKIVIIDQAVAFVGGIDLCYGRWDDFKHRLTDLGNVAATPATEISTPGTALPCPVNAFETDFKLGMNGNAGIYEEDMMMMQPSPENMKCNTPEMERKSILTTVRSKGREFMHMLSITSDEDGDEDEEEVGDPQEVQTADKEVTSVLTEDVLLSSDESGDEGKVGEGVESTSKLWPGKDYSNFIVKDFNDLDQPFQDLVDRTKTPRMPWHDIGVMVDGAAARDVARHFIQRWNAAKLEKAKLNPQYPYLLPKSYKNITKAFSLPDVREMRVQCQVVRSVSHWSGGFLEVETWEGSIHEAYIDAIAKSEHYVYIENQFFISSLPSLQVKNQVADAIYKRVLRAHREGSVFRVYIVLPLLPGFEGEVGTPSGTALHAITHWNYSTISRGKESLLVRLSEAGIEDPSEYITFHGLRNHSTLNGKPITELIYVHSKLLIVDDRLVICGSANINDRSLLGKRDSEIALVIEDEEFRPGLMNGKAFKSGKYCGSLRKYLFKEHLGLVDGSEGKDGKIDVTDPTCSHFYHQVWRSRALTNTEIYEMVFRCIPSDKAKDFASLKKYQQETSVSDADPIATQTLLSRVKGHLVMLPLNFLHDENLTPNPGTVQGFLPTSLWT